MDSHREIFAKSAAETQRFGQDFANCLKGGEVLALVGDLGSGKTTFVQGLARGLGAARKIISPTFILQRQYLVSRPVSHITELYHLDLYRLEGNVNQELLRLGIADVWGKEQNVVVIEWAEKAKEVLPSSTVWLRFKVDEEKRKIVVDYK